jgi:hypothetical protein
MQRRREAVDASAASKIVSMAPMHGRQTSWHGTRMGRRARAMKLAPRSYRLLPATLICAAHAACSSEDILGSPAEDGGAAETSLRDGPSGSSESGPPFKGDGGTPTDGSLEGGSDSSQPGMTDGPSGPGDGPSESSDDAYADTTTPPADTGGPPTDAGGPTLSVGILIDYDNAKSNTGGIAGFVSRTGVVPFVVSNFMDISQGSFDTAGAQGFMDEAVSSGVKAVSISLASGDTRIPAATQAQLSTAVSYGVNKGLIVQIRFGYEMTGDWSPSYHKGDPTIFKRTWSQVAAAVHGAGGQMVWAPTFYGVMPYDTFLPADTSTIDVIGLDFYHIPDVATDLTIDPTETDMAFATIYPLVQQLDKPFVLTETAVSYTDSSGTWPVATPDEVAEKKTWLDQITSSDLVAKYPLYSGFVWFDYNKNESGEYRDFSISQQPLEATMFSSWVSQSRSALTLSQ